MSYPLGYDPAGLKPIVTIKDFDGNTAYRFESADLVDGTPRQDFNLVSWNIHMGINSDHGSAMIGIDDRDNNLVDLITAGRSLKIRNDWEIVIELGKHKDNIQTWFTGIIEQPELSHPGKNMQEIALAAVGWGIRTAHRYVNFQHHQAKLDGEVLDGNDESSKVSEIFKSVLMDQSNYLLGGDVADGITADENIQDIDIRLPAFSKKYETAGAVLSELANTAGAVYGIDPDKKAFLRLHGAIASDFLVTNDVNPPTLLTQNWDQDKIMYLKNANFNYKDSTIDSGYTTLIGLDAIQTTNIHEQTESNALRDLSATSIAMPFTVTRNVASVLFFISKLTSGAPVTADLFCTIHPATSTIDYDAAITLASFIIPASRINKLITGTRLTAYLEQQIDRTAIVQGGTYWLVLHRFGDTTNPIRIDYKTATGTYQANGTLLTGAMKLTVKSYTTLNIIAQNTRHAAGRHKETIFNFSSFPTEESITNTFEGLLELYGSTRRIYDPITIETPADRPPLGTTIRIINNISGLDINAELIGYDISGSAFDPDSNLGASTMQIHVEEWK